MMRSGSAQVLDLSKPLDHSLEIFRTDHYSDPPFEVSTWSTVATDGFWVSKLALGTQTGTHIDAPAHFAAGGATIEQLEPDRLIGAFLLVDLWLGEAESLTVARRGYQNQGILFLRGRPGTSYRFSPAWLAALLELPPRLWVLAGSLVISAAEPYAFHRLLAAASTYLVEDLDEQQALQVQPGGTLIALPIRLTGVSGAPCRVVVIQPSS